MNTFAKFGLKKRVVCRNETNVCFKSSLICRQALLDDNINNNSSSEPKWRIGESDVVSTWVSKVNCIYTSFVLLRPEICLKKLAPPSHPIRGKTKSNLVSLLEIFPRFAEANNIYLDVWLVQWISCVIPDWPEWLFWFSFYDTLFFLYQNQYNY